MRLVNRRQLARDAFKQRALFRRSSIEFLRFLLRFDGFPILDHVRRTPSGLIAKHMWMSADELVADLLNDRVDVKRSLLFSELRLKHNVKQEITELFGNAVEIGKVDRFENFIDFLDKHRLQGIEVLFLIPRTAVWSTQRGHDLDKSFESFACAVVGHRAIIAGGDAKKMLHSV